MATSPAIEKNSVSSAIYAFLAKRAVKTFFAAEDRGGVQRMNTKKQKNLLVYF